MQTPLRLVCLILLASSSAVGQTLNHSAPGENPGDRSGSALAVGQMRVVTLGGLGPVCNIGPRLATGAPGWSSDRGRVEFWGTDGVSWTVEAAITGGSPGDDFGEAICGDGDLDGGPDDWVIGAPGWSLHTGYVRAVGSGDCAPSSQTQPPLFTTLWTAYGGAPTDRFGHAVAILDDVNNDGVDDVLVGAPLRHNTGVFGPAIADAGAVYLLSGANGAVIRSHFGTTTSGYLGWAIEVIEDVDGDGKRDYLVGEPGYDVVNGTTTWNQAGRVRAYSGWTGSSIATLWHEGPKANAQYGRTIADVGDVNKDGVRDFCVGAPLYDSGSIFMIIDTGRVEVRSGADAALLMSMNGPAGSRFGTAIAGGHDLLDDGFPELLVGGPTHDNDRGMARLISTRTQSTVYEVTGNIGEELGAAVSMDGSTWRVGTPGRSSDRGGFREYHGQVEWEMTGPFVEWGSSVAVLDDVDGDGWDDFAVGQYSRTATFLVPVLEIRSGRTSAVLHAFSSSAQHGHNVACLGDVDGDGTRDIAHALPWEGQVHIRSGGDPGTVIRTHVSAPGHWFGHAMADAGDVDGDGTADYIIGEPGLGTVGVDDRGMVRVFSGATGALIHLHLGIDAGDELGTSVAGLGDVDGDGRDDYGAGAPFHDSVASLHVGRAHVWSGIDGSLIWSATGSNPNGRLGHAMCSPGDVDGDGLSDFAVGEPFWGIGPADANGRVRLFEGGPVGSGHPVIHTFFGTGADMNAGFAMTAMGDVDRDGVGDLAYSSPRIGVGSGATVRVVSGATGAEIHCRADNLSTTEDFGHVISGHGGAHADGRQELLIGIPHSTNPGQAFMIFLPEARSAVLGSGCGTSGPGQPSLSLTAPRLGRLTTMTLQGFPPGQTIGVPVSRQLMVSHPVSGPLLLGSGCEVWLDISSTSLLTTITNSTFGAGFDVLVPDDVTLAGVTIHLQALQLHGNAPLGFVLSNGVALTFGF